MTNRATRRDIIFGVVLILAAIGSYEVLNHVGRAKLIHIDTPLDALIPLVPVFVIPYLSFIPLVFVVVPLLAIRSKQVFMSYAIAVFAAQMVLNALYLLVPATVSRPEVTGTDVFSVLLRDLVWGLDEPINTFPSNHVALSVIAILALAQLGLNRRLVLVLQLWLAVICISTLLVHQHIIWDVLAGAAIGATAYWAVAKIYARSIARRG